MLERYDYFLLMGLLFFSRNFFFLCVPFYHISTERAKMAAVLRGDGVDLEEDLTLADVPRRAYSSNSRGRGHNDNDSMSDLGSGGAEEARRSPARPSSRRPYPIQSLFV